MEIKVPQLGESVAEATVAKWFKAVGETVERDEPIVELETDKVTLEVPAAESGTLESIIVEAGNEVEVGAVLGMIGDGNGVAAPALASAAPAAEEPAPESVEAESDLKPAGTDISLSPAVRKMVDEGKIDPSKIAGTGKGGRLTKGDVQAYLDGELAAAPAEQAPTASVKPATPDERGEERVPMTRLRKRIAERLKEAQNTAAMLTTFNEVDMTNVMAARKKYQEDFQKKHGVKLGFMSFFAKACIAALKELPAVNATIDGDDIVYRNFVDLGVAVGTEQGLVVPVLRNADSKSFADIEKEIGALGKRARDGNLSMDELTGGTFTVTNGGVYGSLMSTPILNPPQSGILGMHKIQPRPIAVGDAVEIRPMMYLALSYDHRIIDGSEAVTFLVRVKECIEEPDRILLEI
ncbi:MAG: 2-oxoglutarate dehydrogenase complex dihydrolipoyllysine-residue succinyltransferase [Alphaproteobacteria bacterium]